MRFNELHQDLKDWLMEDDHTYGTARIVKLLEFIKAEDISNITEYLNQIFNLGKSAGSCKCGGTCGCKTPKPDPIDPALVPPILEYKMPCSVCGIDLLQTTLYSCSRSDCPSKFYHM